MYLIVNLIISENIVTMEHYSSYICTFAGKLLTKILKMWQLNLPSYQFNIKKEGEKLFIFDTQRKRFVSLTPEEWVRQNFIRYLIEEKHYPAALIAIETQIIVNTLKKRCDGIIYNRQMQPHIILEFKAPTVEITEETFNQVAVYNYKLQVDFFILSNGIQHFFCQRKTDGTGYSVGVEIPDYGELL